MWYNKFKITLSLKIKYITILEGFIIRLKKRIALLLCFIMLLSNLLVKASNSAYTFKDFTITTILEDEFCTKLKFENKITGSIDYLTILIIVWMKEK